MRSTIFALGFALAAQKVVGHATFQDLWVNGVDQQGTCVRAPPSNSPVTDVTSNNIRCNVNGATGVPGKCKVAAGQEVTVEMHQQPGDRSCASDAIGGDHYGPLQVYLSKVPDSSTADGSTGWFKIFEDTWAPVAGAGSGDSDQWGTKDLNTCCGRMNVKIPSDIPAGDYLLRSEVIALHVASSSGGAQFYLSCYQLTVTGGGSASPALVQFPGAYKASDPGILVNIHAPMSTYVVPGPTLYSGGATKSAGATCSALVEAGSTTGPAFTATAVGGGGSSPATTTAPAKVPTSATSAKTTLATSTVAAGGGGAGCSVAKFGQCGGTGYTGCTVCAAGSTCSAVSPPYYSQCQ